MDRRVRELAPSGLQPLAEYLQASAARGGAAVVHRGVDRRTAAGVSVALGVMVVECGPSRGSMGPGRLPDLAHGSRCGRDRVPACQRGGAVATARTRAAPRLRAVAGLSRGAGRPHGGPGAHRDRRHHRAAVARHRVPAGGVLVRYLAVSYAWREAGFRATRLAAAPGTSGSSETRQQPPRTPDAADPAAGTLRDRLTRGPHPDPAQPARGPAMTIDQQLYGPSMRASAIRTEPQSG